MAAIVRKSRICLFPGNISNYLYKSHISYLSRYSSTSTTENVKTPTLNVPPASELLIEKYQFSPETASKLASVSSLLKNPQNSDSVLSFLIESGFSNTQLEKLVIYDPRLVSSCLVNGIKPKIKSFEDLGFSAVEIAEIITHDPTILKRSAINRIIPSLSVLLGQLGSNAHVTKLLTRNGWTMLRDLKKCLLPNIEFLKSCGVAVEQINSLLYTFPNFFLLRPENLRRCVHKVDEMGVDRSSKKFIYAVRVVSSMNDATWELKLKTFRDLGFSEDEILRVFREAPVVLSLSGRKIKNVKEVLLETGKYDMSCIVNCPTSLAYSVEKRYKPRLQILKDLEKGGLINKWPSLGSVSRITDEMFFKRFVALNVNEVGKDFVGKTDFSDKTPQNSDSVLSFLTESGFSNTQLEKIVIYDPRLVSSCLVTGIKLKIKIFEDLGFSAVEIAEIITHDPTILKRSTINRIIPSLSVLLGLLGSNAHVTELLTRNGWTMLRDLKKCLVPNVEFLKSCGVTVEQINGLLYTFPNFFLLRPKNIRRCVHKVDEMGVDRSSKKFIYAVRVVSSMSDATWELKLKTFRDLGFSEDEILSV